MEDIIFSAKQVQGKKADCGDGSDLPLGILQVAPAAVGSAGLFRDHVVALRG